MKRGPLFCVAALILIVFAPVAIRAGDVLKQVPNDALGFVVVHNLNAVDAKLRGLSAELRQEVFSPLAFLKTVTGIRDGLDPKGDCLFVVYKDAGAENAQVRFGLWLPVVDYARFVKAICATSADGVAAATVAGEELLVAHRGDWAILMDPDQRQRMAQLISVSPSPAPPMKDWQAWIDGNDITVVALAPGIHEVLSMAEEAAENSKSGNDTADDLFGSSDNSGRQNNLATTAAHRASPGGLAAVLTELHQWTTATPAITQAVQQANMFGCGVRLNLNGSQSGNVQTKLRVAFDEAIETESSGADVGLPFSMYDSGGFVIHAAGRLPKPILVGLASAYLQRFAEELKKEEHTELDDDALKQLNEAVEQAAAKVHSAALLTQPGSQPQPIYTNDFLALRVSSASVFLNHATEVMRLWNKANRDAQGETRLVFEAEESKVAGRTATQYSIDMAPVAGEPVLPETRQAMEKLFGPGGKLRIWFVPADRNTVLLARGTADQVAAALKLFDRKQPIDWDRAELGESNHLLSPKSTWRIFFDPHRFNEWQRREAMAITGVPVIGGPLVKPFRDCPPIGIAGGFRDHELNIEMVALEPTVKSAYDYLTTTKTRPDVRRLQPAPR